MTLSLALYAAGVLVGLAVMRDGWRSRVPTALLWPLGPLAFCVVVSIMLIAAAILWPLPVLGGAAVIGGVIWLLV